MVSYLSEFQRSGHVEKKNTSNPQMEIDKKKMEISGSERGIRIYRKGDPGRTTVRVIIKWSRAYRSTGC